MRQPHPPSPGLPYSVARSLGVARQAKSSSSSRSVTSSAISARTLSWPPSVSAVRSERGGGCALVRRHLLPRQNRRRRQERRVVPVAARRFAEGKDQVTAFAGRRGLDQPQRRGAGRATRRPRLRPGQRCQQRQPHRHQGAQAAVSRRNCHGTTSRPMICSGTAGPAPARTTTDSPVAKPAPPTRWLMVTPSDTSSTNSPAGSGCRTA